MMSRKLGVCGLSAALCLGALGCASEKDALEKRVSSMQEELVAVQNSNDRLAERLIAIEMRQAQAPAARSSRAPSPSDPAEEEGTIERPPLKVVRLAPGARAPAEAQDPADETEDATPRPVIRDIGSGTKKARARATPAGLGQNEGRAEKPSGDF